MFKKFRDKKRFNTGRNRFSGGQSKESPEMDCVEKKDEARADTTFPDTEKEAARGEGAAAAPAKAKAATQAKSCK